MAITIYCFLATAQMKEKIWCTLNKIKCDEEIIRKLMTIIATLKCVSSFRKHINGKYYLMVLSCTISSLFIFSSATISFLAFFQPGEHRP